MYFPIAAQRAVNVTSFSEQPGTQDHKRSEEILEEMKVEPVDEKLGRYKSNRLRHVTRMNSNRMPKIMLN